MCRNPVRDTSGIIWDFLVSVNIGLMLPSDCVQFQSDHVQSGVPAGQRVCGSQGRHLGPQRHQDPTCGARDSVCRYFLLCSRTLFTSYSLYFFFISVAVVLSLASSSVFKLRGSCVFIFPSVVYNVNIFKHV